MNLAPAGFCVVGRRGERDLRIAHRIVDRGRGHITTLCGLTVARAFSGPRFGQLYCRICGAVPKHPASCVGGRPDDRRFSYADRA